MFHSSSPKTFEYSVRESRRVRGVKIAVKPYQGIEVIVPPRFPRRQIGGILQQHAGWLNRQLEKHADSFTQAELPDQLHFPLCDAHFPVAYIADRKPGFRLVDSTLQIRHSTRPQAIDALRRFVRTQARCHLPPMLEQIAARHGFEYCKVSIRSQKTRWGSCSSRATISLNDQLLFLPQATVEYLMIHELCHTRHMNHSARFWQLVRQHCADFKQHDAALSRGGDRVPAWFRASLLARP